MPHLVSAFRALQQAVPTALSSSYHPIWPLIPSTSIHSSDTSWNFISPKKCPRGLKNEASSHQLISVTQSCPTLCHPMDCSTPGFSVFLYVPEFTQVHVHWVTQISWGNAEWSTNRWFFFSSCKNLRGFDRLICIDYLLPRSKAWVPSPWAIVSEGNFIHHSPSPRCPHYP